MLTLIISQSWSSRNGWAKEAVESRNLWTLSVFIFVKAVLINWAQSWIRKDFAKSVYQKFSAKTLCSHLREVDFAQFLWGLKTLTCYTLIAAANLCFSERSIYREEVLAIVMQRLMEQSPLPTLLMRTVIQSLSMYPRLIGFVLNILQRLIKKEVWFASQFLCRIDSLGSHLHVNPQIYESCSNEEL